MASGGLNPPPSEPEHPGQHRSAPPTQLTLGRTPPNTTTPALCLLHPSATRAVYCTDRAAGRCSVPPWPARLLKGTTAPVSDRSSTPGGGHNTRHPTGIRIVVLVLALAALVLGPLGYLMGLRADPQHGTAAEWFTLAFGAAVGIPLLAAAVSTVAGDRRAALWSLALLLWPLVFVSTLHLTNLGG